jgi:vacuolar-type H+-ATPase subunit E/Vma4
VVDIATVSIVGRVVGFVDSPSEIDRSDNLSGEVTVEVTTDQIGVQNTVETTVELFFGSSLARARPVSVMRQSKSRRV